MTDIVALARKYIALDKTLLSGEEILAMAKALVQADENATTNARLLDEALREKHSRGEADRESIIEACAKVVDLEAGWCIEEAVKANARGAGVTANLLCGKRDSLVTAAVKIRAMLRGTSPRNPIAEAEARGAEVVKTMLDNIKPD